MRQLPTYSGYRSKFITKVIDPMGRVKLLHKYVIWADSFKRAIKITKKLAKKSGELPRGSYISSGLAK